MDRSESIPYLHPFQAEALVALASRKVNLVLTAPTGSGKGIVLEHLARDPGERIVLISPLIALGRQQAARFRNKGIRCHSRMGGAVEAERIFDPATRVWILSPESALNPARLREIVEWKPTLLAVDEAHCLCEWGEDFRPAYGRLPELATTLGVERTLWMSATFPRRLFGALENQIGGDWHFQGNFQLPAGLMIAETRVSYADRLELVYSSVAKRSAPGLLFVGTRKNVGRYQNLLSPLRTFLPYHAGLGDEERRNIERRLNSEAAAKLGKVGASVIATNAFGMGMDFPQFDWVTLAQTPFSLLGLMQALGRVGRGGRSGNAELFWAEEDFRIAGFLVGADRSERRSAQDLATLREYLESGAEDRQALLQNEFL